MKFKCPECGDILNRDMRETANKNNLTDKGFKSMCDKSGYKDVYCRKEKE